MTPITEAAELAQVPFIRQGGYCSVSVDGDVVENVRFQLGPRHREEQTRRNAGLRVRSERQEFIFVTEDLPEGEPHEGWTVIHSGVTYRVTALDGEAFWLSPHGHITRLYTQRVDPQSFQYE